MIVRLFLARRSVQWGGDIRSLSLSPSPYMKRTRESRTVALIKEERDAAWAAWQALVKEYDEHPRVQEAVVQTRRDKLAASLPSSVRFQITDRIWPGKGLMEAFTCKHEINDDSSSGPQWVYNLEVAFAEGPPSTFVVTGGSRFASSYELWWVKTVVFTPSAVDLWERALEANKKDPAAAVAVCWFAWLVHGKDTDSPDCFYRAEDIIETN